VVARELSPPHAKEALRVQQDYHDHDYDQPHVWNAPAHRLGAVALSEETDGELHALSHDLDRGPLGGRRPTNGAKTQNLN
jgi:hypothetical protein